jgi:hypothetical protein
MSAARRNPRSAQHAAAWPEYLCRAVLHGECALLPHIVSPFLCGGLVGELGAGSCYCGRQVPVPCGRWSVSSVLVLARKG